VNLGNGEQFRGVPFVVTVTAGGPGVGTLHSVVGGFDRAPGDTTPGKATTTCRRRLDQRGN
jgi:hypothetical protein